MEASRKKRYERQATEITMSAQKWRLLKAIVDCRVISSHQLVRLLGLGDKTLRYHLRQLFDAGIVDVVPVSRMSLIDPAAAIDCGVLFGSAPNIYTPTKEGLKLLSRAGLIDLDDVKYQPYKYTVRNSMFLAHELMIRDVYIWLKKIDGWETKRWDVGEECAITLPNKKILRPDGLAIVSEDTRTLVGFIEADRGTERGSKRWEEKFYNYADLMASDLLEGITGYVRARVLVIVPSESRAKQLHGLIESFLSKKPLPPRRYFIAQLSDLYDADMSTCIWLVPGEIGKQSMI